MNNIEETTYYASLNGRNGTRKRSRTRSLMPNMNFRRNNVMADSFFTRNDFRKLINKAIRFFYKERNEYVRYNNQNLHPIYKKILDTLPTITDSKRRYRGHPVIKFNWDTQIDCSSVSECINDYHIDAITIKSRKLNGIDIAYILYNGKKMTAIPNETTFMNGLTAKEDAIMKVIFNDPEALSADGLRLEHFEYIDIGPELNTIVNKNKTARLRFANRVQIREIPNRRTMRRIIREWEK